MSVCVGEGAKGTEARHARLISQNLKVLGIVDRQVGHIHHTLRNLQNRLVTRAAITIIAPELRARAHGRDLIARERSLELVARPRDHRLRLLLIQYVVKLQDVRRGRRLLRRLGERDWSVLREGGQSALKHRVQASRCIDPWHCVPTLASVLLRRADVTCLRAAREHKAPIRVALARGGPIVALFMRVLALGQAADEIRV